MSNETENQAKPITIEETCDMLLRAAHRAASLYSADAVQFVRAYCDLKYQTTSALALKPSGLDAGAQL